MADIIYSETDNVGVIQLNKEHKLNALDYNLLQKLEQCIIAISQNKNLKLLILRGTKKCFSAGGDLNYMSKMNKSEATEVSQWIQKIFSSIENLPIFTMAIIEGICYGGGLELAMSCDVRIACRGSKFSLPEMKFGIIPAGGGTIRFQELSSYNDCIYAMSSGKVYEADQALNKGIIQDIIEENEIENFTKNYANNIDNFNVDEIKKIKHHLKNICERKSAYTREAEIFGNLLEDNGSKMIKHLFTKEK